MSAISQAVLADAAIAVGAMDVNRRMALADDIFAHQPNLLASVLVQQRMGASLQQIEVLLNILFVAYQAMKTSGRRWPVISEATQERCLQRLPGKARFTEALGPELLQRAVQDQIDAHGEPHLLAFAFGQLREHGLLGIETEVEKYLVLAAVNLVDCIAATAPAPAGTKAVALRSGGAPR
jgi:hypothetical protein